MKLQSSHHRQLAGRLISDRFVILLHSQFVDPVSLPLGAVLRLSCVLLLFCGALVRRIVFGGLFGQGRLID